MRLSRLYSMITASALAAASRWTDLER